LDPGLPPVSGAGALRPETDPRRMSQVVFGQDGDPIRKIDRTEKRVPGAADPLILREPTQRLEDFLPRGDVATHGRSGILPVVGPLLYPFMGVY
jgi:hypothetical protein